MATFSSFKAYGDSLASIVDPAANRRVIDRAGRAGKSISLEHIEAAAGTDRIMSNFRLHRASGVRLNAGYDHVPGSDAAVIVNMRPKGPMVLLSSGRNARGLIDTDRYQAVMTPFGPRAYSTYGPSQGTGVIGKARAEMERELPRVANRAHQDEIRKAIL